MAYPTYAQLRGTRFQPLDAPERFESTAGEVKTYTTFTTAPGVFIVLHRLTSAQLESLEADYDTNRRSSFSFTFDADSSSHTVYYEGPPVSQRVAVNLHDVEVRLRVAT